MKEEHKLAAKVGVVLGVILLLVVAYYGGAFTQFGYAPPSMTQLPSGGTSGTGATSGSSGTSGTTYANIVGTFWLYDQAFYSLNPSETSNSYMEWYALRGGSYVPLGNAGGNGYTQVETTAADNGVVYAVPVQGSGQIFDAAKTAQANSAITAINFKDITGTGNPEFVCTVSLTQVAKPVQGYPSLSIVAFYLKDASSDVTLSTLSNLVAGTSQASNYVEWYLTFGHAAESLAFYKLQVKMSTTDTSIAKVANIEVPGVGPVQGSALHYWYDSSYQYFEYTVGTGNLNDCGFINVPLSAPLKVYVSATISTHLVSSPVSVTYTVFALDNTGATVTFSDTISLTTS